MVSGHERKTTGSYYTPTSLVDCLLDSALDPVLGEVSEKTNPEQAILDLKHHEAAQLPFRTAHSDPTEVGPVHLSLLSTKAAQAQEGFLVDRAHNSDPTAQLPYRTRVATHPDHLEQPCGAQPGMLAQRLLDEFLVRVDRARARRWRAAWGVRQRSLHRFRMQPPND